MGASLVGKPASAWVKFTGWLQVTLGLLFLVIHHSASGKTTTVADIDAWHRGRGWIGIAYHWVIERLPHPHPVTGRPDRDDRGRPAPVMGASTFGLNKQCLAICVVGNFDEEKPSEELLAELARVVAIAMKRHKINPKRVIGHRDAVKYSKTAEPSACPGAHLYAALPRVIQMAQDLIKAGKIAA